MNELQFTLYYEFNTELFIFVTFPTPYEALRVGTYVEKYFFRVQFLMASDDGVLDKLLFYSDVVL